MDNFFNVNLDYNVLIAYIFGIILLYLVGRVLLIPLKFLFKLIINGLVGGAILWVINLIGSYFGFNVALNPVTALVVGFLGIPGVILLFALKYIMG